MFYTAPPDLHTLEIDLDLSHREHLAVKHLLTCSALADAYDAPDRIFLLPDADGTPDRRLIVHDLQAARFSSGEWALVGVLAHLVGHGRLPDLGVVDGHQRRIVHECMQTLQAVGS